MISEHTRRVKGHHPDKLVQIQEIYTLLQYQLSRVLITSSSQWLPNRTLCSHDGKRRHVSEVSTVVQDVERTRGTVSRHKSPYTSKIPQFSSLIIKARDDDP